MQYAQNPLIILCIRLILGWVFMSFSIEKIIDPLAFARSISNYHILPDSAVNIVALVLPWVEFLAGLFVFIGVRLKASSLIIGSMLVVFIMAIFTAMMRGFDISCGCSAGGQKVGWSKVLEDVLWLAMSVWIYLAPRKEYTLESFLLHENQENHQVVMESGTP